MSARPSCVVGTSGHIDHGKTSLVRALTGVDLDTLPEEQERGITIALGFAPLDLPDGRRVAFVDVPGHERLVRTMISGATGLDAALLCVSAVDGVMPQTREHVAILDLLGVRDGAVVLTMADLVDDELLELARDDVEGAVKGTFLEGKPIVAWSAVTKQGRDEVIALLGGFAARPRPTEGPYRLPIDRIFSRPGFGTVVTGTGASGVLADGATARILPEGLSARVRGLQVHGESVPEARAGWRTAINLAAVEREGFERGSVLVVGDVPNASILDVRYRHLADAPPLPDGAGIRVLHGTTEREGHLHVGEGDEIPPGFDGWAQLRLAAPLPCWPGDRFVIRRPSPAETLGGGQIVDPWAPRLRRRDAARWISELDRLAAGDRGVWLERVGEHGLEPAAWAARGGGPGVEIGDRVFAVPVAARLEDALSGAVARFHADHPLQRGAGRRELHKERLGHLSERTFDALVERLVAAGEVEVEGPMLRAAGFRVRLDPAQQKLRDAIRAHVVSAVAEGVKTKDLYELFPDPQAPALVHLLEGEGEFQPVAQLGWVSKPVLDTVIGQVRAYFETNEQLTPAAFKDLTGLSRKSAIPLLEWLDKSKVTKRLGDVRVRGA